MVSTTFQSDGQFGSASDGAAAEAERLGPSRWVVNPLFDGLFVFGGLLWILFGLQILVFHWDNPSVQAPGFAGHFAFFLVLAATLGGYLFSDAHTVATYMRIYANQQNRDRFKLYAYYLPWCSALLFYLCMTNPKAAGFCVYLHLMWVYQHYVGQTFGISLIYCYKRQYFFKPWERETYRWFMHSVSAVVITRILCNREYTPYEYFGIKLPFYAVSPVFEAIAKTFFLFMVVAFVTVIVTKFVREKKLIPLPTLALIFSVMAIGWSTGYANSVIWIYGPSFFHGSQYLAVSLGFYLKEKGLDAGRMGEVGGNMLREFFSSAALRYWGIVISAGIVIYVAIPQALEAYGYQFVMTATIIQACVNFHHFVTDGAVWRLRDQKCRDILLA
ncbi:MAG: hypothetical protein KGS72_15670 [Cyanobacteria bacterium REEB67]|nr:hypothetical protein [Cyanobacteria bacterium REEB67]